VTRLVVKDSVRSETITDEKKWDRIREVFKDYKWTEYNIASGTIAKSSSDWICFIKQLYRAGFSREQGDFVIDDRGVRFNSLPLNQ